MPDYAWESLLRKWNTELLNAANIDDYDLQQDVLKSGWLGFPGATEAQIAAAEARLGSGAFPPSYRQFLAFTNGWRYTGTFIDRLWSAEEIDWLRVRNGDLIDIYSTIPDPKLDDHRYFDYANDEAASTIRTEHLDTLLEISDIGDAALYILNPNIRDTDGEWEAWFYASWLPGFHRYPSFWALMQAEHETFKQLEAQEQIRYRPDKATGTLREKLPGLIQELERCAQEMGRLNVVQSGMAPFGALNEAYNKGFMQGLQDAAQRVRKLVNEVSDESGLLDGLHQLVNTLGREAQNLQPRMAARDVFAIATNPARVRETLTRAGMLAGKQKALGTIEWFLNP